MNDTRMPVPLDPETAFDLYMRHTDRSYVKLAELTGISLNTIRKWAVRNRWADQANALDEQSRRANRQHILTVLDAGMPAALKTIRARMDSANERISLDAANDWADHWARYRTLAGDDTLSREDEDDQDPDDVADDELFAAFKRRAQR